MYLHKKFFIHIVVLFEPRPETICDVLKRGETLEDYVYSYCSYVQETYAVTASAGFIPQRPFG